MILEEPLTEWFFVEPKMVLLWHRLKNLLKHLYFEQCMDKSNKYKTMFYFFGKQDWPQNIFLILIDQIFFGLSVQQRQTGLL